MSTRQPNRCPDCEPHVNRRDFVKAAGAAALAAGTVPLLGRTTQAARPMVTPETTVKQLYDTLTDAQKKVICLPFNHEKRTRISANWKVTEPDIEDKFYSNEQRALINEIVRGVTSEDGYERLLKQMDDDSGGIGLYSTAIFGQPGTDQFEWELTGRHLTLRCDGNSVENMAFGGPLVYGHAEEDNLEANLFFYQTKKANEVFEALDTEQRKKALVAKAPRENQVPLQGEKGKFPGVAVGELSGDQKDLVEAVIKVMLAVYREEDVKEAVQYLKKGGGLDGLHMAFYQQGDLGSDKVWDIWRVEGPSFVWHFRGAPHVHTYVNIGLKG